MVEVFSNIALQVHRAIEQVCPIVGVSIGDKNNKATWRIDFTPEATSKQQEAAAKVVLDFSPTPAKPIVSLDQLIKRIENLERKVK